jgi:hypothetical protein
MEACVVLFIACITVEYKGMNQTGWVFKWNSTLRSVINRILFLHVEFSGSL